MSIVETYFERPHVKESIMSIFQNIFFVTGDNWCTLCMTNRFRAVFSIRTMWRLKRSTLIVSSNWTRNNFHIVKYRRKTIWNYWFSLKNKPKGKLIHKLHTIFLSTKILISQNAFHNVDVIREHGLYIALLYFLHNTTKFCFYVKRSE